MTTTIEKNLKLARDVQELIRASQPPHSFFNVTSPQPRKYKEFLGQYTGWVYSCASKNAASVASVPLRLYAAVGSGGLRAKVQSRRVSKAVKDHLHSKSHLGPIMGGAAHVEEITSHPFLELIRQVNPVDNGFEVLELMTLSLELTGNCYWFILKDPGTGIPLEIWPLESHLMNIRKSPAGYIDHYEYGAQKPHKEFPIEEIIHFKYPNPLDRYYGMGPLEASQLPVILNNRFDIFENAMLENGAVIPFFLSTEQQLNKEAQSRLRQAIDAVHRGFKRAGKWGLAWGGLKPHSIGSRPKDVNYKEGHSLTKEKIAAAFGVPLSLVTTEDVNLANAKSGIEMYMRFSILPRLKRIEQVLNQDLMPLYDEKLFVSFDNPVPQDKEFDLKEASERLDNQSLTVNEYRERMGEDPVPWGEEPIVTSQQHPFSQWEYWRLKDTSIEESSAELARKAEADEAAAQQPDMADLGEPEGVQEDDEGKWYVGKSQSPLASKTLQSAVRKWVNTTAIVTGQNLASLTVLDQTSLDILVPWNEVEAEGRDLLTDPIADTLHSGAKTGVHRMARVGVSSAWDISNPHAIEWAKNYVGKRITLITDETRSALRQIINDGMRQGKTVNELKREIRSQVGLNRPQAKALENFEAKLRGQGLSQSTIDAAKQEYRQKLLNDRSEMIARTETAAAWAEGNIESYREAGIAQKEFSAVDDACPICSPLNGNKYHIGSEEVQIPLHPNCRCDWLPVVSEDINDG